MLVRPGFTRIAAWTALGVAGVLIAALPLIANTPRDGDDPVGVMLTDTPDPLATRITTNASPEPVPAHETLDQIANLLGVRIALMSSTVSALEETVALSLTGVSAATAIRVLLGAIDEDLVLRRYDDFFVVDYRTDEEKQAIEGKRRAQLEEIREQSEADRKRTREDHPMLRRTTASAEEERMSGPRCP